MSDSKPPKKRQGEKREELTPKNKDAHAMRNERVPENTGEPPSAAIPNPEPAPEDVPSGTEAPPGPTKPRAIRARMRAVPLPALARSSRGAAPTDAPPALASKRVPSLVLPNFDDTFSRPPRVWPPRAGLWERTVGAVNAYLFPRSARHGHRPKVTTSLPVQSQRGSTAPHLHAEHEQAMPRAYKVLGDARTGHVRGYERVSKVVVIGVHGWFAQSIFKNVMGTPTGTSARFATMMAESVRRHFQEAGNPLPDEAITVIAPQYDGRVEERADFFFDTIAQNAQWVDALREADAVMVAAHSQGAVVSTLLLARLVDEGFVSPKRSRTCVLSMCGIYQGPFVHLKSSLASSYINYFETGAARELFEFQSSDTAISARHREAYGRLLTAGIKFVHIGSIDDNVVPLYSALNSSAAHPSILRAVYIDGVAFPETDFLISLIILCVAVRNCGFHDHNLLTLLSASVAGSLYGGLGHSLVYDEENVYDLATRYLFETNSPRSSGATHIPLVTTSFAAQRWNPYELPWGLRGLLEDTTIQHFFGDDIVEVIQDYHDWHPASKPLRDLQWRLSPIRSIPLPPDPDAESMLPSAEDSSTGTAAVSMERPRMALSKL